MYTLRSWRSPLCNVAVDFLHQEPAITVGDPFAAYIPQAVIQVLKAYVPGEVIQVSRITNVNSKMLEKFPRYRGSRPFAPGTRLNRGGPIYSLFS